jgi:hypothetical protein
MQIRSAVIIEQQSWTEMSVIKPLVIKLLVWCMHIYTCKSTLHNVHDANTSWLLQSYRNKTPISGSRILLPRMPHMTAIIHSWPTHVPQNTTITFRYERRLRTKRNHTNSDKNCSSQDNRCGMLVQMLSV